LAAIREPGVRALPAAVARSVAPRSFVGVGLRQAGYDLAGGLHTPRRIGECFHGNMLRLADNAQLQLDATDRVALHDWLLGGLPPDRPVATG
jgi:hypothetical protein